MKTVRISLGRREVLVLILDGARVLQAMVYTF